MHTLLEARGKIVRKEEVMIKVWGTNETSDESVSRTVYRLRVAMQSSGGPEVVETIYNSGFRITAAIRETTMKESSSLNALTHSARPGAITALMSAREFLARQSVEDIDAAANAVRLAINLDPSFAAAWATLAEIRIVQALRSLRPPREAGWLAKEATKTALNIDPQSTSALAIQGWVRVMIDRDCERGMEDLDRAMAIDPDFWVSNMFRGWVLQAAGRHEESVTMMRRALELNSVSHAVNSILALYLMFSGNNAEALQVALDLAKRFPTVDNSQGIASILASVNGMHDEAVSFGWRAMELAPHTPLMHTPLAYALAYAGRHEEAWDVLGAIEKSNLPQPSASIAPVYLALGEPEKAIALLQDACERGVPQFAWSRDDPRLAALRGNSEVERLWARIWPRQMVDSLAA
ncbi:winged helix-turn-helix domain-containing protein [Rhodoferax sp. GW822-FHT02A01]|uniref:winged helix-turn-helix domain-containing protein n=1 Tax=Rhodoferax sp. GW822-FHT02A01 TaxID=3141537 RepID=UPI00315CBE62